MRPRGLVRTACRPAVGVALSEVQASVGETPLRSRWRISRSRARLRALPLSAGLRGGPDISRPIIYRALAAPISYAPCTADEKHEPLAPPISAYRRLLCPRFLVQDAIDIAEYANAIL